MTTIGIGIRQNFSGGLGWNNVGSALQTVAQHYINIAPMYRVIWVVAFLATRGEKRHPHSSPSKHGTIIQCCFNFGPASKTLGQHRNSIGQMARVCWGAACWGAAAKYTTDPVLE